MEPEADEHVEILKVRDAVYTQAQHGVILGIRTEKSVYWFLFKPALAKRIARGMLTAIDESPVYSDDTLLAFRAARFKCKLGATPKEAAVEFGIDPDMLISWIDKLNHPSYESESPSRPGPPDAQQLRKGQPS